MTYSEIASLIISSVMQAVLIVVCFIGAEKMWKRRRAVLAFFFVVLGFFNLLAAIAMVTSSVQKVEREAILQAIQRHQAMQPCLPESPPPRGKMQV